MNGEWSPWASKVPKIEVETHKVGSPDIVVPTLDTVRHESLLNTWLADHKPLVKDVFVVKSFTVTIYIHITSFNHSQVFSGTVLYKLLFSLLHL